MAAIDLIRSMWKSGDSSTAKCMDSPFTCPWKAGPDVARVGWPEVAQAHPRDGPHHVGGPPEIVQYRKYGPVSKATECDGKQAHATKAAALTHRWSFARRTGAARIGVYRCRHCKKIPRRKPARHTQRKAADEMTERNMVRRYTQDGPVVIVAPQDFDVYTAGAVRAAAVEAIAAGHYSIVFDLDEACRYMDSTALGVLIGALRRVRAHDGRMAVVCTQERMLRAFEITGLTMVLDVHQTVEDAAASVGGDGRCLSPGRRLTTSSAGWPVPFVSPDRRSPDELCDWHLRRAQVAGVGVRGGTAEDLAFADPRKARTVYTT